MMSHRARLEGIALLGTSTHLTPCLQAFPQCHPAHGWGCPGALRVCMPPSSHLHMCDLDIVTHAHALGL